MEQALHSILPKLLKETASERLELDWALNTVKNKNEIDFVERDHLYLLKKWVGHIVIVFNSLVCFFCGLVTACEMKKIFRK